MSQVDFYHLTRTPIETVLPKLLEKILAGGGRALVVAGNIELLGRLDDQLWRYDAASFLPHGRAGEGDEAEQPVLLAERADPLNAARFLLVADGQWPENAETFERVFFLFDESTIANARAQWRGLTLPKRYWKQDERGRWVKGP